MTGSIHYTSRSGIVCRICAGSVSLESSKTDERGKAVHEECYVREAISTFRKTQWSTFCFDEATAVPVAVFSKWVLPTSTL
jgi:hypothetical protein